MRRIPTGPQPTRNLGQAEESFKPRQKSKKTKAGAPFMPVVPRSPVPTDSQPMIAIKPENFGLMIQKITSKDTPKSIKVKKNKTNWILKALVELAKNFDNSNAPADQLQKELQRLIKLFTTPETQLETSKEEYIRNEIQRMFKKSVRKEWDEIQYNIMRDWQDSPPPPGSLGDKTGIARLNLDAQLAFFKRLEKALNEFNLRMSVNQEILQQQKKNEKV